VLPWSLSEASIDCGDVVIEAFGCNPPEALVQRMANRDITPLWINLEYLSAQPFAAQNHAMGSPQLSGAGMGLAKWFFQPGFTAGTAGLIREPDLQARQLAFDALAWRAALGLAAQAGERSVSLFCYANAGLPELFDALSQQPTLLLATPGAATEQLCQLLGPTLQRGHVRGIALPWLSQLDFDHLLWSCDINFVRGEDSWVRAQWASRPFVWQPYVQSDSAHHAKLHAFLDLYLAGTNPALGRDVRALWACWNRLPNAWNARAKALIGFPDFAQWQGLQGRWRQTLSEQTDLTTQLLEFARDRR
jgi:uncharacterized repeat protein (TIGR03837 family)